MNYEEFMKYVDKMNNNIRKNLKKGLAKIVSIC